MSRTSAAESDTTPEPITFQAVLAVIDGADTLTPGVKANLRHAVERTAHLVSPVGLTAPVDVPAISKVFARLSAARLGLKSVASLAAFKSNLRRALRLAGIDVMPGRHVTPISDEWSLLLARVDDRSIRMRLSRFVHVASHQGWRPAEVGPEHIERFRSIMLNTNLGSKTEKVIRNTVGAWHAAHTLVPGWPEQDIGRQPGSDHYYSLPWSAFPPSLEEDVRRFLDRPGGDWLDLDTTDRRPLRPRTLKNYADAYRRAASILVIQGSSADDIHTLASLITIPAAQTILGFLMNRTQRKEGGAVAYMAFALYFAAKDHVRVAPPKLLRLEQF